MASGRSRVCTGDQIRVGRYLHPWSMPRSLGFESWILQAGCQGARSKLEVKVCDCAQPRTRSIAFGKSSSPARYSTVLYGNGKTHKGFIKPMGKETWGSLCSLCGDDDGARKVFFVPLRFIKPSGVVSRVSLCPQLFFFNAMRSTFIACVKRAWAVKGGLGEAVNCGQKMPGYRTVVYHPVGAPDGPIAHRTNAVTVTYCTVRRQERRSQGLTAFALQGARKKKTKKKSRGQRSAAEFQKQFSVEAFCRL